MFTESITLDRPLPPRQGQELEKRIFFLSDRIVAFKLIEDHGLIHGVELTTSTPLGAEELARRLKHVVANEIAGLLDVPQKVLWRAAGTRPCDPEIFERMVAAGVAAEVGEGQICLGEPFIALMNYFDRELRRIALELGGREFQYPTLIPTTVLETCGYFGSFPQLLMFVTRLHSDLDTYNRFLEEYRAGQDVRAFALRYSDDLSYCLPPTMCFHTYHQYRDQTLAGDQQVVTARGKSFRFESRYVRSLERLWDFTIREIVFMGTREFVLDCRKTFMQRTFALIDSLGLMGFCEVASDPFFGNADTVEKIVSQKILELKYELRLHVTDERTIAAGSFNFHESFFGEGFNIRRGAGEPIKTACVGFGLERLTYAFLCQYGLDERAWPAAVREGVRRD